METRAVVANRQERSGGLAHASGRSRIVGVKVGGLALAALLGQGSGGALCLSMAAPALSTGSPAVAASTAKAPAPEALLEKVLRRYGSYQDFQVRFVESAASRVGGEDPPEYGTVSFKRPEMWRWEYTAPERKVVVIRDSIATIKIEGDPDVARYALGSSEGRSDVGALLAGNEALAKLFKVRYERSGGGEDPWLRLDPIRLADEYDHVLVKVNARDLTIRGVVVVDPGGNTLKFAFTDLRANTGLPAELFEPPPKTVPDAGQPRQPTGAQGR